MPSSTIAPKDSSSSKGRAFVPFKESAWVWDALTDDSAAAVIVVDSMGVIEFANDKAVEWHGLKSRDGCVGKPLTDYLEMELVRERFAIAKESLAAGRSITIEGMSNGALLHCTFRPIPGGHVLCVSRLASPADPTSDKVPAGVVKARVDDPGLLGTLTNREMQILKLIGLGLSSAAIAKRLDRSVKTVEWHRVSLGDKLSVTNRVELARIAIGAGLVGPEKPRPAKSR